jgi:serine/threonine-protein kinase
MTSLEAAQAGRYTPERELGRGGMVTVYLARDLKHDRPVVRRCSTPRLAATLARERSLPKSGSTLTCLTPTSSGYLIRARPAPAVVHNALR